MCYDLFPSQICHDFVTFVTPSQMRDRYFRLLNTMRSILSDDSMRRHPGECVAVVWLFRSDPSMATLIIAGYTACCTAWQAYALCGMRYLGILLLPYLNYYRCKLQVDGVVSKKRFDRLSAGLRSMCLE